MIKDTHNKKRGAYGAFVGLVFSALLIFGLFVAIPAKTAQADNNFFDNVVFTSDSNDLYLGFNPIKVSFHVKTTFQITFWIDGSKCWSCFGFSPDAVYQADGQHFYYPSTPFYNRYILVPVNSSSITTLTCPVGTQTFTAGQTYSFWLSHYYDWFGLSSSVLFNGLYPASWGVFNNTCLPSGDYWSGDTEQYPFVEYPTLAITYPQENDEIANAFYIQGSFTIPSGSGYNKLVAYVGRAIPYAQYSFIQELVGDSGAVNLRISGIPAGENYNLYFYFIGDGISYFAGEVNNVNILLDIAPELPQTYEISPDVFSNLSAQTIYGLYSNYDTSTPLFNTISNAVEPLILTIGDNLTFFSSQFSQTNAKDIGEKTGNGVLLVRAYSGNINSFFNDLPISEILFLYLMTLIVVSVFRIIRILIKLIPFS